MTDRWNSKDIPLNNEIEGAPVPIVSDGAIATIGVADGRLVPLIIIDTASRPDVENLMRVHKHVEIGDVESAWVRLSMKNESIGLMLNFLRPSRCIVILQFDLPFRAGLVDWIVRAQGLYLQSGREGDRLKSTIGKERILIEVQTRAFQKEWDRMLLNAKERDFRKLGLSRTEAKRSAQEFVNHWRKMVAMRIKDI